jgi:hypothetical protein
MVISVGPQLLWNLVVLDHLSAKAVGWLDQGTGESDGSCTLRANFTSSSDGLDVGIVCGIMGNWKNGNFSEAENGA